MQRSSFAPCAIAVLATALPASLCGQWLGYPTAGVPRTPDGKPNLSAPAPRTAAGTPDLSGMWGWQTSVPCAAHCSDLEVSNIGREFFNLAYTLKGGLPYQPWAAQLVRQRRANQAKDDPNVRCMPRGALRIWTDDYYKRIVEAPDRVIVLAERNMQYRQIFTDGRPLPEDPNPTWNGYSTGKWEGDTLVVHSIGFRDDLWLDSNGNPLTNAAKVTEKLRRPNYGTLEIEITVDDPKAYTAPWTVKMTQPLVLDSELLDYYCLENEKDFAHMVGK
ncbi:MAG TPA: hypothetical protein VMB25_09370 [Bryobacteraceae bacterium]|nr:hypothetical protein [Bryobacteraceae bacterium]